MGREKMTEEKWQAIIENDASYNDIFFYAVQTTRIFCKPSCKSRIPKKENVRIFHQAADAIAAGFRPCKRCKPTNERLPDREWVAIITQYIDNNYANKLTLEVLGEVSHGSPYHLQRTFKKVTGISPTEYTQQVRIARATKLLIETERAIATIAEDVGIGNVPYFMTTFKKITGRTPTTYRKEHRKIKNPEVKK